MYTIQRIKRQLAVAGRLNERLSNLCDIASIGSFESIDSYNDNGVNAKVSVYAGCGSYDTEIVLLPYRWIVSDDPWSLIKAEHEASRIKKEAERQAQLRIEAANRATAAAAAEEKRVERELAELARLKAIYDNQGETP